MREVTARHVSRACAGEARVACPGQQAANRLADSRADSQATCVLRRGKCREESESRPGGDGLIEFPSNCKRALLIGRVVAFPLSLSITRRVSDFSSHAVIVVRVAHPSREFLSSSLFFHKPVIQRRHYTQCRTKSAPRAEEETRPDSSSAKSSRGSTSQSKTPQPSPRSEQRHSSRPPIYTRCAHSPPGAILALADGVGPKTDTAAS